MISHSKFVNLIKDMKEPYPVLRMGHPLLRKKSDPLDPSCIVKPEFQRFIRTMASMMVSGKGQEFDHVHIIT
jgi:hypothetical protein